MSRSIGARAWMVVCLPLLLVLGCSNPISDLVLEDVLVANAGGRPVIASVGPAAGATDVNGDQAISVTFETDMDPSSITESSFTVMAGDTPVSGAVEYNADTRTARFTPSADYPRSATIAVEVSAGIRNAGGATLAEPLSFQFATADVYNYEIRAILHPDGEAVSASQPLYLLAANIEGISTGFDGLGLARLDSLTTPTEVFLDLREDFDPASDYWLVVHWDLNNSAGDGSDAASFDPDNPVEGFLAEGFEGRPHHTLDPDDHVAYFARQSPSGTVSFPTMGLIYNVDRYEKEEGDVGTASNPDMALRGGDSVELSLVPIVDLSDGSSDLTELSVTAGTPLEIDVEQYGLYWFRFTPTADFVPTRLKLAEGDTGVPSVYVKADLWNAKPESDSQTSDREFYSVNDAETDFGFSWSLAELEYDFAAGTEYFLRVQIMHIQGPDGRFVSRAPMRIEFE